MQQAQPLGCNLDVENIDAGDAGTGLSCVSPPAAAQTRASARCSNGRARHNSCRTHPAGAPISGCVGGPTRCAMLDEQPGRQAALSEFSIPAPASIRLDAGVFDHLLPLAELDLHESS